MALEEGRFFIGSISDRRHNADGFAEYGRRFLTSGVWEFGDNLNVTPAGGMTVNIGFGNALVDGYPYRLRDNGTGPLTLRAEDADNEPRIDRVVIRKDVITQRVYAYIKKGVPAASPSPPELARTVAAYEISLKRILVASGAVEITADDLIDEHDDADVCGLVTSKISVNGPASAADGNLPVFDKTTGKLVKDSGKKPSDFEPANPNIQNHIGSTGNPHNVTKEQLGLGSVTGDKQVKAILLSVDGNLMIWDGSSGDTPKDSGKKISDLVLSSFLNKLIWTGSWGSGDITVPGSAPYGIFRMHVAGTNIDIIAIRISGASGINAIGGFYNATNKEGSVHFNCVVTGEVWTWVGMGRIYHTPGGGHSTEAITTIDYIYGVC